LYLQRQRAGCIQYSCIGGERPSFFAACTKRVVSKQKKPVFDLSSFFPPCTVIENEFGDGLSIESMIARDGVDRTNSSLADFVELPNGCVCCTVKDSLVSTLERLLEKRRDLDYVLVECSGMANPGPVASIFWLDGALESRLRLDGIVTLVDAKNIARQLEETEEAAQQIAYADRVVVNKIDLVVDAVDSSSSSSSCRQSVQGVVEMVKRVAQPSAPVRVTTFAAIPDLDWILDVRCFDNDNEAAERRRVRDLDRLLLEIYGPPSPTSEFDAGRGHHDHNHRDHGDDDGDNNSSCNICSNVLTRTVLQQQQQQSDHHRHTEAVSTIALVETGSVDLQRLNRWLADVLWPNQDEKDGVLRSRLERQLQQQEEIEEDSNEDDGGDDDEGPASHLAHESKTTTRATRQQQQVFRIKGIVSVRHCDRDALLPDECRFVHGGTGVDARRYIVQAVYDLWDVYPAGDDLQWSDGDERMCKIVVIGRALDVRGLELGFRSCF